MNEQDAEIQEAFDAETKAYLHINERDTPAREERAAQLDTNDVEFAFQADDTQFAFAKKDWNDTADEVTLSRHCNTIYDQLRRQGATQNPTRDTIHSIEKLLNASFSEQIKVHIVQLVAGTEIIEGTCRHCFGLYGEDSHRVGPPMAIWFSLCQLLGEAPIYYAFLERAWHLNPASPYFPQQYRYLVQAIRASNLDKTERPTYANPHSQMELFNETLKKLAYSFRHTTNPVEISKLANAQVRVAGALHVLNGKMDSQAKSTHRLTAYSTL